MQELLAKANELEVKYRIIGRAHYLASDQCALLNRLLGLPVIVITALVGTSIFGTLGDNPDPKWKIAAGLISLTGTALSAVQASLGYARRAEQHKAAGEAYRAMRRKFEMYRLRYSKAEATQREAALDALNLLVEELAALPKEYPIVPDRCYDRAVAEQEPTATAYARSTELAE